MPQSKPKKVLFLITKSNWGGAQRYVYDLATNLDRNKFEPVVVLGGDGPLASMLNNANIRVIALTEMKNSTSLKQAWSAFRELRRVVRFEAPSVLHLNSSIAGLLGAIVGHTVRVPTIIFTAHGWAFNEDRPFWQRLLVKFFHYLTVLLTDQTIAVSSAIVQQMNWLGAQKRMKIINPGRTIGPMYDKQEAREKLAGFCSSLAEFVDDCWLVCIAELHPIKRHSILLTVVANLVNTNPKTRLILLGEGVERAALEKQIADLGLTDNVFMLGNIVEAARFLKAFDVFVLASKSESYGYVLHEAGLAGIPIVATNVGGIPDIISTQSEGLLVPPDDTEAILRALHEIIKNPKEAQGRSETLYKKLINRSVQKMTMQTESLYTHSH